MLRICMPGLELHISTLISMVISNPDGNASRTISIQNINQSIGHLEQAHRVHTLRELHQCLSPQYARGSCAQVRMGLAGLASNVIRDM